MKKVVWMTLLLCLSVMVGQTLAQDACSELVQEALAATDEFCTDTGRNEACYGNVQIEAELTEDLPFAATGDRVPLDAIERLTLAGLDTSAGTWGVTLLKVQADIPDTMPGENITFLLFGDVQIENAADATAQNPMQAVYFRSGIGSPQCTEAPDGILVQTPEGVAQVNFTINGAEVTLGSTAFFQTRMNDEGKPPSLTMSVLEGGGTIEAFGVVQPVFAGSWVRVPIDEDFNVAAAPLPPKPYQFDTFDVLPTSHLERQFEVTESLTQEQIDGLLQTLSVVNTSEVFTQTLTNSLDTAVTVSIPGHETIALEAGASATLDLFNGTYRWTVCRGEECVAYITRVSEVATHTINETLFQ